jgi:hypothetical protein
MDAVQFFLEQYNTIRTTVDDLVFAGLGDEQLRQSPSQDQNSLAWLLWHASRWEDFVLSLLDTNHLQVLDQEDWLGRLNLSRRDGGTAMTAQECSDFNAHVNITGLRAYWAAVGQRTRQVAQALRPEELDEAVDESLLAQAFTNGIIGNERARWVEQLCAGRNKAWFLSLVVWHQAEHLLGEALCVRSQAGMALGL